jgi:small conductance mechanosensitive channel
MTAPSPLAHALLALAQDASHPTAMTRADETVTLGSFTLHRTTFELVGRIGNTALTVAVALVLLRLVPVLERLVIRFATKNEPQSATTSMLDHRQRVETLTRVVSSLARAVIWSMTVIMVLGNLGVAIGPLTAGAGVAGVAVGFGAQSIVKDFFSGFFILLENQYAVGDTVTVAGVTGTVERMTMRITVLRDANGTAHFIPNSNISNVANKTYGWGRAIVDVSFARDVSEDDARGVLQAAAARVAEKPGLEGVILESVVVEGPLEFTPGGLSWRLVAKSHASRVADAKRALISALDGELRARGFVAEGGVMARK